MYGTGGETHIGVSKTFAFLSAVCFLSVSTRIRVSGHAGVFIRVSGYTGVWVCGYQDIRVYGICVYHVVMATATNHWNSCISFSNTDVNKITHTCVHFSTLQSVTLHSVTLQSVTLHSVTFTLNLETDKTLSLHVTCSPQTASITSSCL